MIDVTLHLAAQHPKRMLARLRRAFGRGVLDQEKVRADSNYDRPLVDAYRAGKQLREALLKLGGAP
jgi:hypothetical protein